ncbi:GGDEF domain-containing protein [Bacillus pinisoli]|uniref:GGDEF domain-containing protein n=1 Tax=Bacillus pinisoli TaxID=2901866 RepID=UPI001FF6CE2D
MSHKIVQLDNYKLEQIFTGLRWVFLLVAVIFFYYPPVASVLNYTKYSFSILLTFGLVYMTITQLVLLYKGANKRIFGIIMKTGIIFDLVAASWLLILSGGAQSNLFPIFYLIIMHATIYWRISGAIFSFMTMLVTYTIIFLLDPTGINGITLIDYSLNVIFLFIIGLLGAVIVTRERLQYSKSNQYRDKLNRDYLTGLYNHRHFQEQLLHQKDITVGMIDIDYFKQVNDTYGHVVGDSVLRELGQLLEDAIPSNKGMVFRYGGEEFSIIFFSTSLQDIKAYILKIYDNLNEHIFYSDQQTFHITISMGIANEESFHLERKELTKIADELLYEAKNTGKNRAIFSNGETVINEQAKEVVFN